MLSILSGGKLVIGDQPITRGEDDEHPREAYPGPLALADELQSISRACKVAGISRSHFYEIKDAFENYGRGGLAPQPRRRPRMPNETPPELERQILVMTREYPTYSYMKIADQLS